MINGLQDLNSRTLYTNNDGIAPVPLFKRLHRPCLCTILVTRFWPPEVKNMIPEFYGFSDIGRMIIHIKPLWLYVVITYHRIFFQNLTRLQKFGVSLVFDFSHFLKWNFNYKYIVSKSNGCLWFCGKLFCKWIWTTISAIHDLSRSSTY